MYNDNYNDKHDNNNKNKLDLSLSNIKSYHQSDYQKQLYTLGRLNSH